MQRQSSSLSLTAFFIPGMTPLFRCCVVGHALEEMRRLGSNAAARYRLLMSAFSLPVSQNWIERLVGSSQTGQQFHASTSGDLEPVSDVNYGGRFGVNYPGRFCLMV